MQRLAIITLVASIVAVPGSSCAVDLNGRWLFGGQGVSTVVVPVTQTGSALSVQWVVTFTGSVGTTDADGFTSYQVSWTDGTNQVGFGGRITPSGNLFDGRGASYYPPSLPAVGGLFATRCTCVDNNTTDGDGCSAACQVEPCWSCAGDPSVCTPTGDGGACDDGSPCTTGETCSAGVCGGGTAVSPCFDLSGPWTRHQSAPALGLEIHAATIVEQHGTDLWIGSHVGSIDPATGAFNVRSPNLELFCWSFDTLIGSVAPDGLTYSASGLAEIPYAFAPDHCDRIAVAEIGDHCGDGNLDGVEQCDDGNLTSDDGCSPVCQVDACYACSGSPSVCAPAAGDPCDDGDACTATSFCQSDGSCAGGTSVTCEPCFSCDAALGCVARPQATCQASVSPARSSVYIGDSPDDVRDRFGWRWKNGADVTLSELGDPPGGTAVSVCMYDESSATPSLLFRATIPGGGGWGSTATGYRYRDAGATGDGMTTGALVSGTGGKARAAAKGKGGGLSNRSYGLPAPPLPLPLRIQLQGDNGLCLETRHDSSSVRRNDAGTFKAEGVP